MCYAHFGYTTEVLKFLDLGEKQLLLWDALIRDYISKYEGATIMPENMAEYLLQKDPLLADFSNLPKDIKIREGENILSSVRGFLDYVFQNTKAS